MPPQPTLDPEATSRSSGADDTRHTPGPLAGDPTVSIVMIFLNAERFIEEAIASVHAQTYSDWELILVDDGSSDRSSEIAQDYARDCPTRVRYLDHAGHRNLGMSPSRNAGLGIARGRFVAFLDADDTWRAKKLYEQVSMLDETASASAIYGTPLYWHGWTGDSDDRARDHVPDLNFAADRLFEPPELLFLTHPLGDGPVPCPSDILVRREALQRVGGFEPRFRGAYEDVAFFVKLYLHEPILATTHCWTKYRIHADSCMATAVRDGKYSSNRLFFLNWFEEYLFQNKLKDTAAWRGLQEKLSPFRTPLALSAMHPPSNARLRADPNPVPVGSSCTTISWSTGTGTTGQVWISRDGGGETLFAEGASGAQDAPWINPGSTYEFRLYGDVSRATLLDTLTVGRVVDPGVGGESFGSLRRVTPISNEFGFDRGQPIDRFYIDRFLTEHAADIRGRVLEIGESTYTKRFGRADVSHIDVLHVKEGNPEATLVGDLARGDHLPSSAFDCILLIQTLHLIFDAVAAVRTLHRMLKPGGIILATFPGISQRSQDEWGSTWYWGFTALSARRLFTDVFQPERLAVTSLGNVLASTAFLYGLSSAELTRDELLYQDERYETLVAVRAVK